MPAKKKTIVLPVASKAKAPTESVELGLIRKLAEILNETGLTEISARGLECLADIDANKAAEK